MSPLADVRRRLDEACARAGREPSSVRIVAVSKLQTVDAIRSLIAEGQADFGENYVQELTGKIDALAKEAPRWHLIGHLQRNKIKFVSGRCAMIHSVDSVALAEALDRKAAEKGAIENILLQVNLAGEDSKEGFTAAVMREALPRLTALENIQLHGLMTMPPLQNRPEQNRPHFRALRELLEECRILVPGHPWQELSMGTSQDFEVAAEEGATLVRVGTILFGARPQSPA